MLQGTLQSKNFCKRPHNCGGMPILCLHVFITVIFGGYLVTFARRAVGSSCRKPIKPRITRSHARDAVLVWVDAGGIGGTYGHWAGPLGAVWERVVLCRQSSFTRAMNKHQQASCPRLLSRVQPCGGIYMRWECVCTVRGPISSTTVL